MIKALDLSFSAKDVTPAWCRAMQLEGYKILIADLWTGNRGIEGTEQALQHWREAGGVVAAYLVVHDGATADWHVKNARIHAGSLWEKLNFICVDVEVDPTSAELISNAVELIQRSGRRPLIYTSRDSWGRLLRNTEKFSNLPLWDASWGVEPSLAMAKEYGGWERRVGHQFKAESLLDGVYCDESVFDEEWILAGEGLSSLETSINVARGWGAQFALLASRLDLPIDVRELLSQGSYELTDVSRMLEEYRVAHPI